MANGVPRAALLEIGASGLQRTGGFIYSDDSFLPHLSWRQSVQIYSEMRNNDPTVGASLFAIDNLIRGVNWNVLPFSNSAGDKDTAQFVDECIHDMESSWQDTVSESLSMLPFGWAFHEVVYKRRNGEATNDLNDARGLGSKYDDGKIGWKKAQLRAQETLMQWEFDDGNVNTILGMWQLSPPDFELVYIPMSKAILFRTTTVKNDPMGRSILRNAYRPYYFKKRIEEVEGVGIERDLAGLPLAYVDPQIMSDEATPDQQAMLNGIKTIVRNTRRDAQEGVIFPMLYDENGKQLYSFTLLSSPGNRQIEVGAVITRKAAEIASTMLTDFLALGHEGIGSYALSNDKTTMFGNAIGTYLDIIAECWNHQGIRRLLKINGLDTSRPPKLVHGDVNDANLAALAAYITSLSTAGLVGTPDPAFLNWLRDQASMPHIDPNMPLAPPATPPSGPNGHSPAVPALAPAAGSQPPLRSAYVPGVPSNGKTPVSGKKVAPSTSSPNGPLRKGSTSNDDNYDDRGVYSPLNKSWEEFEAELTKASEAWRTEPRDSKGRWTKKGTTALRAVPDLDTDIGRLSPRAVVPDHQKQAVLDDFLDQLRQSYATGVTSEAPGKTVGEIRETHATLGHLVEHGRQMRSYTETELKQVEHRLKKMETEMVKSGAKETKQTFAIHMACVIGGLILAGIAAGLGAGIIVSLAVTYLPTAAQEILDLYARGKHA